MYSGKLVGSDGSASDRLYSLQFKPVVFSTAIQPPQTGGWHSFQNYRL